MSFWFRTASMLYPYKRLPRSSNTSDPQIPMPFLPVTFYRGDESTLPIFALLDSGADRTIMPSDFAEQLGIVDFKKGRLEATVGVGQQMVDVFYHSDIQVQLSGDSRKLQIEIGFIETTEERRAIPLLGRTFFHHFKSVSFYQVKEKMELIV